MVVFRLLEKFSVKKDRMFLFFPQTAEIQGFPAAYLKSITSLVDVFFVTEIVISAHHRALLAVLQFASYETFFSTDFSFKR